VFWFLHLLDILSFGKKFFFFDRNFQSNFSYDETFQKVVSFKETPLASVDKIEVG
jgi:hypothetical protein